MSIREFYINCESGFITLNWQIQGKRKLLQVEHRENFLNDDMEIKNLMKYFDRVDSSIRKAITKMNFILELLILLNIRKNIES